jgi:type IV secretion system protein VirB1
MERAAQGRRIKEDTDVLPGMELMSCPNLAVPRDVMHHVVRVESSYNPYAIGVVGGRLARQPRNLAEAVSTARMLEQRGYNFSLGLAQVNRYNLTKYGLTSYEQAFQPCANLVAGSRILRECYGRSGNDWGKSFSCYYSGDFKTGFRHGYVQKVYASMQRGGNALPAGPAQGVAVALLGRAEQRGAPAPDSLPRWEGSVGSLAQIVERRVTPDNTRTAAVAPSARASVDSSVATATVGQVPEEPGTPPSNKTVRLVSEVPPASPVVVAATRVGSVQAQPQALRVPQVGSDGAFVF